MSGCPSKAEQPQPNDTSVSFTRTHTMILKKIFFITAINFTGVISSMTGKSTAAAMAGAGRTSSGTSRQLSTVMVTGANGYIGSYIVKELLTKGYTVHACVRDADNKESVQHLLDLVSKNSSEMTKTKQTTSLKLFSTGDLATAKENHSFDEPMRGCDATIHSATPLPNRSGEPFDGKSTLFDPAMESTQELLDCIDRINNNNDFKESESSPPSPKEENKIHSLILTSSMSAVAPVPEPAIKNESHWSDAERQKSKNNWYGATKTSQELLVRNWISNKNKNNDKNQEGGGGGGKSFHYAAICPTIVFGPPLKTEKPVRGTMSSLKRWCTGGLGNPIPNDSMSMVHVEDTAKLHVAALETVASPYDRYMCVVESWHWNDILKTIKEKYYPQLPTYVPACQNVDNDDAANQQQKLIRPTQFDNKQRESLNIPFRPIEDILRESIEYLRQNGDL